MDKHNIISLQESTADALAEVLKEGAQRLLAQAINAEVDELIEQHQDRLTDDGRAGVVRNGYLPERDLQTGIGPITVKIPKVRAKTGEPVRFNSKLVPPYVRKSGSLATALCWLYLKGVSTGDMSDALAALVGDAAKGMSSSTVARLKKEWSQEYLEWRQRSLADRKWVYIWVDGIYNRVRGSADKLCTLVVIGVDERGVKSLLSVVPGVRESSQSWREVLMDLKARGMNAPHLAVGDGAMGFWNALSELWPTTCRQRCWMHKMGSVLNRLPKLSQTSAKRDLQNIWQAATRADAERAFDQFVATYEAKFPDAVATLVKDRDDLMTFYDFPAEHWRSIRTTNPMESTFGTIRHRMRQTKGCVSRESALHMIFKLGCEAEKQWRRLRGFNLLAEVVSGVVFIDGPRALEHDNREPKEHRWQQVA